MKKLLLACLFLFIIVGCGQNPALSEDKKTVGENEHIVTLAELDHVRLLSDAPTDDGMFLGITVMVNDKSRLFPNWKNVQNETYYPNITLADINQDGQNEVIILLITGYGIGVYEEEIHVLNMESLEELEIEIPLAYIEKHATSTITKVNGKVYVRAEIDGQALEKVYDESDAGVWNEEVGFGAIVRYEVSDNQVIAKIPGSISPAAFAFTVQLEYDENLKIKGVKLVDDLSDETTSPNQEDRANESEKQIEAELIGIEGIDKEQVYNLQFENVQTPAKTFKEFKVMEKGVIKQILVEEVFDKYTFVVYKKKNQPETTANDDLDYDYVGFFINGAGTTLYEIGEIGYSSFDGDLRSYPMEKVTLFNKELLSVRGFCGLTCPLTYYLDISSEKFPYLFLHVEGNGVETDITGDGINDLVSSVGTALYTTLYLEENGKMMKSDLFKNTKYNSSSA
ncbi:hypothetical protein [Caldalkalibacillus mannanilyticus]|uniref:hypothetical protein n=1 Tax=Caldalkalibacillus mannanilyticus TaxID=1418 RepID=UPI0004691EC3|nr:hypothetical protein [Caldalkalibacillus mannanilyticus]